MSLTKCAVLRVASMKDRPKTCLAIYTETNAPYHCFQLFHTTAKG